MGNFMNEWHDIKNWMDDQIKRFQIFIKEEVMQTE